MFSRLVWFYLTTSLVLLGLATVLIGSFIFFFRQNGEQDDDA